MKRWFIMNFHLKTDDNNIEGEMMKLKGFGIIAMLLILMSIPALAQESTHNLMPVPAELSFGQGELIIDGTFRVEITGYNSSRLEKAAGRILERINKQTGIFFLAVDEQEGAETTLTISVKGAGEKIQSIHEDESYSLEIGEKGALLTANTDVGALRGIETFLQLIEPGSNGFSVPFVKINDKPRFRWRGLLVDVCRHWQPKEVVLRTLDAMAACKMNVLHWHLSEDQGFRVESKVFPLLHQKASDGNYYTQEEIKEVIAYARDRGIRVIPEFDVPGHTTAWLYAYPELASKVPGPEGIARKFGVLYPVMDPTNEKLYQHLDAFIGEMAGLFEDDYFHIGGDEVEDHNWKENEKIQAFMKARGMKDSPDLQAYFNTRLLKIIQKHGKKMVGWDEIFHPDLPKDIVVHNWRSEVNLGDIAKQGFYGILSNGYYIDLFKNADKHYKNDPVKRLKERPSDKDLELILGGEATMWGELITPELIDSRIWPRTAAIAERFWSPEDTVDIDDMYRRLEIQSMRLERLGLNHRCIQRVIFERLAPAHETIKHLVTLAKVVEPLEGYRRHSVGQYKTYTPLNRFVDGIPSDSFHSIKFNNRVKRMIASEEGWRLNAVHVRAELEHLVESDSMLQPLLRKSKKLEELIPLSHKVYNLAKTGLEAMDYIEAGRRPEGKWAKDALDLMGFNDEKEERPAYEVEVAILPGLKQLVLRAINK